MYVKSTRSNPLPCRHRKKHQPVSYKTESAYCLLRLNIRAQLVVLDTVLYIPNRSSDELPGLERQPDFQQTAAAGNAVAHLHGRAGANGSQHG